MDEDEEDLQAKGITASFLLLITPGIGETCSNVTIISIVPRDFWKIWIAILK